MEIIKLSEQYRAEVVDRALREWGAPIVSKGQPVDIRDLPGFVCVHGGAVAGELLYRIRDGACEIVLLSCRLQGKGVGSALIAAAVGEARQTGCGRVWLMTTNDNTPAIRFYQKRGFDLCAVDFGAFEVTKRLKETPLPNIVPGVDGIPIRHELEFELAL